MLKVGITGGIGSGKSVVCQVFHTIGIPVLKADDIARYLMEHNAALMAAISGLFGNDAYLNNKLNRDLISSVVYNNPEKLQQLNALVHPATVNYGKQWIAEQTSPYIIKEAAIFFESGTYTDMDIMIGVFCPLPLRIERAMKRGNTTRDKVESIVAQQMNEDEKMKRCDHIITNDDMTAVLPQVLSLHQVLLQRANAV